MDVFFIFHKIENDRRNTNWRHTKRKFTSTRHTVTIWTKRRKCFDVCKKRVGNSLKRTRRIFDDFVESNKFANIEHDVNWSFEWWWRKSRILRRGGWTWIVFETSCGGNKFNWIYQRTTTKAILSLSETMAAAAMAMNFIPGMKEEEHCWDVQNADAMSWNSILRSICPTAPISITFL